MAARGANLPAAAAAVVAALALAGTNPGVVVEAFLPSQNPPWTPTWNMSLSSITMACNSSGWFNLSVGAAFGITSYDVRAGRVGMGGP